MQHYFIGYKTNTTQRYKTTFFMKTRSAVKEISV